MFNLPTKVVSEFTADLLADLGSRTLIVTGQSAKANGILAEITTVLEQAQIQWRIFDQVEQNPSLETVFRAAQENRIFAPSWVLGIGGGSPLDAAKAISLILANPDLEANSLFQVQGRDFLPIVAIPTTAGTGSELTPYSILTDHQRQTKQSLAQSLFPVLAVLNPRYTWSLPAAITLNTASDAFSHLAESYLTTRANPLSDALNESGFLLFKQVQTALLNQQFSSEIRHKLLYMSALGGMAIAQTSTSLPHFLGYALTYHHKIAHGQANALLMSGYLQSLKTSAKLNCLLSLSGFADLSDLDLFFRQLFPQRPQLSEAQIELYSQKASQNTAKLATHPLKLSTSDLEQIYRQING